MSQYVEIKANGVLEKAEVLSVTGKVALSEPYHYIALCNFTQVEPEDISSFIGSRVTFTVSTGSNEYYLNGVISHASITEAGVYVDVEPQFALLRFTQHSRVFQNQDMPSIIKTVLASYELSVKTSLSKTYSPLPYCVQYQESDFQFVIRLLEQAGIFYYFNQGNNQETLVLADQASAYQAGVEQADFSAHALEAGLENMSLNMSLCPAKFTLNSYDFQKSKQKLQVTQTKVIDKMQHSAYEIYDYQPSYQTTQEGQTKLTVLSGAHNNKVKQLTGTSTYLELQPASKLSLAASAAKMAGIKEWVVVALDFSIDTKAMCWYQNRFIAIPSAVVFQPYIKTPKPLAPSAQLATIVGASGAEYNTDQYGRYQVVFPWDLNPKTTQQSVWLRAVSSWEGVFRVGTPVLVSFVDGDIDAPVILGAVHQDNLMPLNPLPDNQTKSVLVRRHLDAATQKTYNSITLEDKKEAQLLYLNATKNMQVDVQQDFNQTVTQGIYHLKVKGDITIETEGKLIVKSQGAMSFTTQDAFNVQAKSIELKADNGVSLAGGQSLQLSGQQVDIKADNAMNLNGGGQMALKAAVIQEN